MRRRLLLCALLLSVAPAFGAKPWKPHAIHVIPGVPLKPQDIKPYVPRTLAPEPPLEPSEVKTIQVTAPEAMIAIRPWSSPMVGNAVQGARLPVRGVVTARGRGCSSKVWYAIEPFGYLCGREANPTTEPPTTEQLLQVRAGSRVPFRYVMVLVKDEVTVPMWDSLDALKQGAEPARQLKKGDTVAIDKPVVVDGTSYWISVEGRVLAQKGTSAMGGGSEWHGVEIDASTPLPFGWVTPEKARVYASPPDKESKPLVVDQLPRRTRLTILDERRVGGRRWLRVTVAAPAPPESVGAILYERPPRQAIATAPPIGINPAPPNGANPTSPIANNPASPNGANSTQPNGASAANGAPTNGTNPPLTPELWVSADAVNEVRRIDPPKTIPPGVTQWVDIDLGEQVLVTYQGDRPLFATLVSSGRAIATPMGTYPVWAKVSAITMKNQPYEDKEYFVNKVPWSTFFQWHNAIHGAYWHDRFGIPKSHGCVNVAPLDARRIFEWVTPPLPPGWTGLRPLNLLESPTVVVRNSHIRKQFRQDRPIGPPDRELEGQRLEEAEQRRATEAAQPVDGQPPLAPGPDTPSVAAPQAGPSVKP